MGVLVISEELGSGGDEVGRVVAGRTGYRYVSRDDIVQHAERRFGQRAEDLNQVLEGKIGYWEIFNESRRWYLTFIESAILDLVEPDRVVMDSRTAVHVLISAPHVLKARIVAPAHLRCEHLRKTERLAPDAAMQRILDSDRERAARIQLLYREDWANPRLYDLVLNRERFGIDQCAEMLVNLLKAPGFEPSNEARQTLKTQSLARRIDAELLADPRTRRLNVHGRVLPGGAVEISGVVGTHRERQEAESVVAAIPDIGSVSNHVEVREPALAGVAVPGFGVRP